MAAPVRARRHGIRWIADVALAPMLAEAAAFGELSLVPFSIPAQPSASSLRLDF